LGRSLEIVEELCAERRALAFGGPIMAGGVAFRPIPLRRLFEFAACLPVLTARQDRERSKALLKLPYMWYIRHAWDNWRILGRPDFEPYMRMLQGILEMATGFGEIGFKIARKPGGALAACELLIGGKALRWRDFDEARRIILRQSGVPWSGAFVNEDAEKAVDEGAKADAAKSGRIPPSLEDLLDLASMYLKMGVDEMAERFTIGKFNALIRRMASFEDYKLLKGAELSGLVSFKSPIPHWIAGEEEPDIFRGERSYEESALLRL
jgi:hypothetical protein